MGQSSQGLQPGQKQSMLAVLSCLDQVVLSYYHSQQGSILSSESNVAILKQVESDRLYRLVDCALAYCQSDREVRQQIALINDQSILVLNSIFGRGLSQVQPFDMVQSQVCLQEVVASYQGQVIGVDMLIAESAERQIDRHLLMGRQQGGDRSNTID